MWRGKRSTVIAAQVGQLKEREQPSARADVHFADSAFEKRLAAAYEKTQEMVEVDMEAGKYKFHVTMHSWPLSPVPLAMAGVLCLLALWTVGAPMWALLAGMITGMLLPFGIAVTWSGLARSNRS